MRLRHRLACMSLLGALACGRTPVIEGPVLLVQVVDETGAGVKRADVELRDGGAVLDRARGDSDGVVVFDYPGAGHYHLKAHTDLQCCGHDGERELTLTHAEDLVIVETRTGPCPTWVPSSCD